MDTATLLGTVQKLLWGGALGVCAALIVKLWAIGLQRTFPFLFMYLVYRLARGLGLYSLPFGTNLYGWAWAISNPLLWLAYILVVLELYSLVLRNYPGIASLGRWIMMGGLAISIGLSGLSLQVDLSNPGELFKRVVVFTAIERGVVSSLAIFLLLITVFMVSYPVPLSRNVLVHSMVLAAFFLGSIMVFLVRNLAGHQVTVPVNIASSALEVSCLIGWVVLLSRAGETGTMVLRRHWRPEQQQRLMDQLSSVNAALLRAAGKTE